MIKERYNIVVNISKCYKGRRIALNIVLEAQTIQFGKLWDYEAELKRSNKGITTEICTADINGVQQCGIIHAIAAELPKAEHQSHCADVHNNLSEAFNRTIKIARTKPVISMLEDIRRQAMKRISRRWLQAERCSTNLTPITMAILEKARVAKKFCSTIRSRTTLYEVNEFDVGYIVDLVTHQCACRRWDLTGIPCKHAICVLDDNQDDAEKYVPDYYSTLCLQKHMLKISDLLMVRSCGKGQIILQLEYPTYASQEVNLKNGTEEKNLLNHFKIQVKLQDTVGYHIARCGQAGLIKSGCKNEPVVVEGPKNRRGRPRKHPAEIHPKRQPKPRKSKNNPLVGSSSQPLQNAQSSSAFPAVSSAPQQSVTSNQPAKHVKKASRGRPLKIRKIENIPSGSGTFWSPFTDRPFEVFGKRVYDRSATDSQHPQ
ncbi:hypothetical protein HA466_0035150 [Hirschfeldia incana]|nr:hypothetical protein HA466_0035150 [Hirschfeldia incana]